MVDLLKGGVFSQTEISAWRGEEESKLDVFEGEGFFQYAAQNPDRQICRFPVQIGLVIFPNAKWGFFSENYWWAMHENQKLENLTEKHTWIIVDDLLDDKECRFSN